MRYSCKPKTAKWIIVCITVLLFTVYYGPLTVRVFEGLIPMDKCPIYGSEFLRMGNSIDVSLDLSARTDVQTCTYWGAPIMWDGVFDPEVYDQVHKKNHTSVALTVFAVGRYLDAYLKDFLNSAELHFMVDLSVTYYVFTDTPDKVPDIQLAPGRNLKVMAVQRYSRWQDISMMRMKAIADAIDFAISFENDYVFCMDVDQVFFGHFGSEALGDSVAVLHAFYYHRPRSMYPYDHNPKSMAYMEKGDFYYHAAIFGGSWQTVKSITETCYQTIMEDKKNQVEALWHDESHLNKYLWLHKPSKVLSPEYCWEPFIGYRSDIRVKRLLWAEKHYNKFRDPEPN